MPTGKVRFYDADKGFGFISEDSGADVFLHANALPEGITTLKKGARVEFGIVEGRKGAQALQVKSAGGTYQALPATVRTWSGPASNETLPVDFKQPIAANDPLRTGTYSKTLTFTLSTTNP